MKGIVERFGGMWNGYTWIDQTTYLETAGRDALEQMLFIEAERMTNSLFDPVECESGGPSSSPSCRVEITIPNRCWIQKSPPRRFARIRIGIRRLAGCTISKR